MIKIFWGGAGVVTPSKPPPPTNNFRLYPPLYTFQILGVAGSEDFSCATLPTTPFDFQGKVKNFCHPILLKIRLKISVTPLLEKEKSQNYGASINSNGLSTLSGLSSLKFLLHMTTSFIKENHFNNCI